jgi:hypothetical protein
LFDRAVDLNLDGPDIHPDLHIRDADNPCAAPVRPLCAHTFASRLVSGGTSLEMIGKLLGLHFGLWRLQPCLPCTTMR